MQQVLLVDDDPGQLRIRQAILRSAGVSTQVATSVESALVSLRAMGHSIGALVTDHCLPGRSGVELVRELRLTEPEMPVMVLSGMSGIEDEYEGLNVSVWLKPFPPDRFIREIQKLVFEPRKELVQGEL